MQPEWSSESWNGIEKQKSEEDKKCRKHSLIIVSSRILIKRVAWPAESPALTTTYTGFVVSAIPQLFPTSLSAASLAASRERQSSAKLLQVISEKPWRKSRGGKAAEEKPHSDWIDRIPHRIDHHPSRREWLQAYRTMTAVSPSQPSPPWL